MAKFYSVRRTYWQIYQNIQLQPILKIVPALWSFEAVIEMNALLVILFSAQESKNEKSIFHQSVTWTENLVRAFLSIAL